MTQKIILHNGRILDPANQVDIIGDLEIVDGKIGNVGESLSLQDATVIDASNMLILPGLIDYHIHLYQGGSLYGLNADLLLATGVTGTVDAGTAGFIGYEEFHRMQNTRTMPFWAFLNLSPMGEIGDIIHEVVDPELMDASIIGQLFKKYPQELVGLKIRLSCSIAGKWGQRSLSKALELAQQLRTRLCVHATDPCVPMAELADQLRAGDILCHVYHGKGDTILDSQGKIHPALLRARERGVIFDAANGRSNLDISVAQAAFKQGFLPDIISTDLTAASIFQGNEANNLPFLLSKYLAFGMSLTDVVKAATMTPAACLGLLDEIGTLTSGRKANIAILSLENRPVCFQDSAKNVIYGSQVLVNHMTFLEGMPVFDDNLLPRT